MPPISVILPVYNQELHLRETLNSIVQQSFRDFEVLILDDGSTDNSANIIRQFSLQDSRIKVFFESNAGKSEATNKLVGRAQGEWCVLLDADDVMEPNRLEKQLAFHQLNPTVYASSAYCQYINEKGNMFGIQRYPGMDTIENFRRTFNTEGYITCSYTCMMIARTVFTAIGGLVKKYEPCEDFEFFNRLADNGYTILIIPEVLMKYRIHPTAITVRQPLLVLNTINYVKHCLTLRRAAKPEISYSEFMHRQQNQAWWIRLNRRRFNYAMIYFRSAGLSMLSKKYMDFFLQITASSVLSPLYVIKKVLNHTR